MTTPTQSVSSAGFISTDFSVMNASATHVDDINSQITAQLTTIRSTVDALAGNTWHGSAAQAFARVMSDWDGAVVRLNGALAGIADQLRANSTAYAHEEDANAASISRTAGIAGPLNLS